MFSNELGVGDGTYNVVCKIYNSKMAANTEGSVLRDEVVHREEDVDDVVVGESDIHAVQHDQTESKFSMILDDMEVV